MDTFQLLIVQTGGTIDKDYPKRKGGYAFEICKSGASTILDKLGPSFHYRLVTACREDSQDLTDQHRKRIAEICRDAAERFILVTHGTDTILQTAAYLDKHLRLDWTASPRPRGERRMDKTVVITGAFLPERFKDTDADFNVGVAIGAMQGGGGGRGEGRGGRGGGGGLPLAPGIYVSIGGRVWPWDHVTRLSDGRYVSRL